MIALMTMIKQMMMMELIADFEKAQRRRKFCETALKLFLFPLAPQQLALLYFNTTLVIRF